MNAYPQTSLSEHDISVKFISPAPRRPGLSERGSRTIVADGYAAVHMFPLAFEFADPQAAMREMLQAG